MTVACPYCQRPLCRTEGRLGKTCGALACRLAALQAGHRAARLAGRHKPRRKPKCCCGCGQRVKRHGLRYLQGHVPRSVNSEGAKKAIRNVAFKHRAKRFSTIFGRLTADGRKITKEAIFDAFTEVERVAYNRGYQAADAKWTGRTFKAA